MNVLGYSRVSTDEQVNGYGLDVQRERVREFCRAERHRLVSLFEDPGVPGSTPLADRPGLSDALTAIHAGDAEALVVARHDRLARDTLEALLIEREFTRAGGRVLYAEGSNGDDPVMQLQREMLHSIAQFEKRQLVARLAAGRRAKAARGGYAGGRPPFGYVAVDGALEPKAEEAEVVRWIFDRVVRDGWSIRQISAALDEQGTLGRRWHRTEVARIVRRADYKTGPAGARIVDSRIFNKAQAMLTERRKR